MTAGDSFDAREENSGVGTVDEQAVLEYLRRYDGATIEGLINATGGTEGHIRAIISKLKDAGQVRIQPRHHSVRIEPLTGVDAGEDPATDGGGVLQRLGNLLTGDDQRLEMTPQQLYHLLSSNRRRKIVRLLAGMYDPDEAFYIGTRELASELADSEAAEPTTNDVHRMYVSLTQVHLPVLDSSGVVDHHDRDEKIRPTKDAVLTASLMREIAAATTGEASGTESEIDGGIDEQ
jgi:hypothetical protein